MTSPITLAPILVNPPGQAPTTAPGWHIAPGLAVCARIGHNLDDGVYLLIHTTTGQAVGGHRCGAHMYDAVERAVNAGIDWTLNGAGVYTACRVLGGPAQILHGGSCLCWGTPGAPRYQPPPQSYPGPYRPGFDTRKAPEFVLRHGIIPTELLWAEGGREQALKEQGLVPTGWWVVDVDDDDDPLPYDLDDPEHGPRHIAGAKLRAVGLIESAAWRRTGLDIQVTDWVRVNPAGWAPVLHVFTHAIRVTAGQRHGEFTVTQAQASKCLRLVDLANQQWAGADAEAGTVRPNGAGSGTLVFDRTASEDDVTGEIHFAARKIDRIEHAITKRPIEPKDWLRRR